MSGNIREIVNIQLGHYANFVGTHWWNIQESSFIYNPSQVDGPKEINHDVLFREGKNLSGQITFTPRLIAVDLKGSLNTLREEGVLYDVPTTNQRDTVFWGEDITLHQTENTKKNEFLQDLEKLDAGEPLAKEEDSSPESDRDESALEATSDPEALAEKKYCLDDKIVVWSDFLRTHLHPRSVYQLPDHQHNNELHRFDMYGYGRTALSQRVVSEALEDRFHYFLEECDQLQGLHLMVDTHNGFGGLASTVIQELQDDYGVRNIMTFGVMPPTYTYNTHLDRGYRILNSVLAYNELASSSSAFVPLSSVMNPWQSSSQHSQMPYLNLNPELSYHTSAVLGASVDTLSLPYRFHNASSVMSHLIDALTSGGRKILGLQTSLPFPFLENSDLYSSLTNLEAEAPWRAVSPLFSHNVDPYCQSVVLRGIHPSQIKGAWSQDNVMPRDVRLAKSADEILQLYLQDRFPNSLSAGATARQPTKVVSPYPHIFTPNVGTHGEISLSQEAAAEDSGGVESICMMTSLQATSCAARLLDTLRENAKALKLKKFTNLLESGVEEDEYTEALSNIASMAEAYRSDMEAIS